ncbi:MAG: DUF742 domain-containing protein [Acidimicrobiales bacterium]
MTHDDRTASSALRVRPYLLTGGRTRSAVDLPLEAQVRTTPAGEEADDGRSPEHREILALCAEPHSVAEISALLDIHLQVARILVGDLVSEELVTTSTASPLPSERPDLHLLERVLDGLQSL